MSSDPIAEDRIRTVTLADGREVADDSLEWRDECLARAKQVDALRHMDLQGRRDYVANVQDREGEVAAQRLLDAYMRDWEERRAKAKAKAATAEREAAMGGALAADITTRQH